MKFINLATDGIVGDFKYDFTRKVAGGCYTLGNTDKNALVTTLAIALFGAEGDEKAIKIPAKSEIRFAVGAKEYTANRLFEEGGEQAVLTNAAGEIMAEGAKDVTDAVIYLLQLDKPSFKKLFLIEKEDLAAVLTAKNEIREGFIAMQLSELITPEEVENRKALLRAEESSLLKRLDSVKPVTRKAIKASQAEVETDRLAVDALRGDIKAVTTNLAKADACEAASKEYFEQAAALEAMGAHKKDIDAKSKALSISKEAAAVKSVFADYLRVNNEVAVATDTLNAKKENLKAIKKRLADGEASELKIQGEAAYYANRTEEYQKGIREFIRSLSDNPTDYKLREGVEAYYKGAEAQLDELFKSRNALIVKRDELKKDIEKLLAKKASLRVSAVAKKSIGDGSILEGKMAVLKSKLTDANARMKENEARLTALVDEEARLAGILGAIKDEMTTLDKTIRGTFKTREDAVNSDVIIKQTLYAKHLIVSANEVELHAVLKKIDDVLKAKAHYDTKLAASMKRKEELNGHLEKLTIRRDLLANKLMEYRAYNKFKELAEDIQYGDRCPICNGFVTSKKEIAPRNTGAVEEQLRAVDEEIQKVKDAINAINENIGQFTAAKTVSDQYTVSLNETAAAKRKIINEILEEYGMKDIPSLFALLKGLLAKSRKLTLDIDKYHATEVELAKYTLLHDNAVAEIAKLTEEVIPAEKKNIAEISAVLKQNSDKYDGIKAVFKGEEAVKLLLKQQVVDRDYESTEDALAGAEAEFERVSAECDRLEKEITILAGRNIAVDVDGKKLDYCQVVIKTMGDDLKHLLDEADLASDNKDVAATRLVAIRKLVAQMQAEKVAAEEEVVAEESALKSAAATASDIYAGYSAKVKALGVSDMAGLEKLILDDATAQDYTKSVAEYDEIVLRMNERLVKLKEEINRDQAHFDSRDKYNEELKALHDKEKDATVELGSAEADCKDKQERYGIITDTNKDLTLVQGRINGLEECDAAISGGAIIAKDFAALVLARASAIISNLSKDKYRLDMKDDGKVVLYNNVRNRVVQDGKHSREEKKLLEMGLSAAYIKMLYSILGTEAFGSVVVKEADCNKASIALMTDVAKEYDLILMPEDNAKFTKVVDKL